MGITWLCGCQAVQLAANQDVQMVQPHAAGQPEPLLPAEAGRLRLCWLPTSCGPCRPLCCAPVPTLNSQSPFYPLARLLQAVKGPSARAGAQQGLPTGSLPLAEPPAGKWMQSRRGAPGGRGGCLWPYRSSRSCPQSPQQAASLAWGSAI